MSFQLPTERKAHGSRPRWAGAAFLVEAMLLLVFLIASFAVFTQLFAAAADRANRSEALTEAVVAASTVAERFAADPAAVQRETREGNMVVICDQAVEPRTAGNVVHATILVYAADGAPSDSSAAQASGNGSSAVEGEPLYVIETARYVGEVI